MLKPRRLSGHDNELLLFNRAFGSAPARRVNARARVTKPAYAGWNTGFKR